MKDRKGFLLAEETLKIVIALICIGFLIYLLTSLYFKSKDDQNLELAKASLEHLVNEANSMQERIPKEVEIYNPDGWVLASWPQISGQSFLNKFSFGIFGDEGGEEVCPKSCSNLDWNECLCICKKNDEDKCDDAGYCLESGLVVGEGYIELENLPLTLNIEGGKITKVVK